MIVWLPDNCVSCIHSLFFSSFHSFLCSSVIGGDCADFIELYPTYSVEYPNWIGDGYCYGGSYNAEECGFDGKFFIGCRLFVRYFHDDVEDVSEGIRGIQERWRRLYFY